MASASTCTGPPSPSGTKTPDSVTGCVSPAGSNSPIRDDACPICLGGITEKCAAEGCFHNFCFVCLKEWSKQRAVCPLCKQSFTKILYSIKSETDYKEYVLPKRLTPSISRFTMHSSFMSGSFLPSVLQSIYDRTSRYSRLPFLPMPRGRRRSDRASSSYRLSLYLEDLWVQPLSDVTGQYRESSPHLYREQPALTHRLVAWVNREIAALVPSSRVSVALVTIMDLIERYPINSREFGRALRPLLGNRTNHFVHEFYNFARSPFDMIGYDLSAVYVQRGQILPTLVDDDQSSDEDDIIEVPISGGSRVLMRSLDIPLHEEIVASTPVVISDSDTPMHPTTSLEDVRSLEEPGPSGVSSCSASVKKEQTGGEENFNDDECHVVTMLRPKRERTPEVIDLLSDSDSEEHVLRSKKTSKRAKKKPTLDRTSFSLHFTGTLRCGHPRESSDDHTYCSGAANAGYLSSTTSEDEYKPPLKRKSSSSDNYSGAKKKRLQSVRRSPRKLQRERSRKRSSKRRIPELSSDDEEEEQERSGSSKRKKRESSRSKKSKKSKKRKRARRIYITSSDDSSCSNIRRKKLSIKSSHSSDSCNSSSSKESSIKNTFPTPEKSGYSSSPLELTPPPRIPPNDDSLSISSLLRIPVSFVASSESEDISKICKTIQLYNKARFPKRRIDSSSTTSPTRSISPPAPILSESSSSPHPIIKRISKAKKKSEIKSSKKRRK